jgi:hypothetical protein
VDFGVSKTAIGPPCGVGQCAIGDIALYGVAEASDGGFKKDVELFDNGSTVYGSCLFIHLGYLHKTRVIRKTAPFSGDKPFILGVKKGSGNALPLPGFPLPGNY